MGYKIEYGQTVRKTTIVDGKPFSLKGTVCVLLFLAFLLTLSLGFSGALRQVIIPGDPDITQAAFSEMITNLSDGMSVGDAITAFCQEIIQHANVS